MLMNGQEVNHLVIGGETFDKSNFIGRKVKAAKGANNHAMPVSFDPKTGYFEPGTTYVCSLGDCIMWEIIAQARISDLIYLIDPINKISGGWAHLSDVEFIEDETGGVNSPFYLLLLYFCIIWLALGVLLLC